MSGGRRLRRWLAVSLAGIAIVAAVIGAVDAMVTSRGDFDPRVIADVNGVAGPDPVAVALQVAGYPDGDGFMPEEIDDACESDRCVVVITDENLGDDSVAAVQVRVELKRSCDVWVPEWIGRRWRCWPNRGIPFWGGWTTIRCS